MSEKETKKKKKTQKKKGGREPNARANRYESNRPNDGNGGIRTKGRGTRVGERGVGKEEGEGSLCNYTLFGANVLTTGRLWGASKHTPDDPLDTRRGLQPSRRQ